MRQIRPSAIIFIFLAMISVPPGVFAGGQGFGHQPPPKEGPPPDGGMHLLMKYEMENTAVNVIAQLTSQPEELIQSSLASSDMPSVLQAYGVDEAAFRAAMKEKILERVTESLSDGRITQEQADSIIDTINSQP